MDRLRLCTINVRSIATEARLADFETSVENIKFDVMGLFETRIPGKGRIDLASGFSLYHSGADGRASRGVGFYVPTSLCGRCNCYYHSERLIETCVKLRDGSTLRVIQATPGPRQSEEFYIGTNAAAPRNCRGQILAEFCEERKLFLANSFFKKKKQERWTWRNDALGLKKEIDYALVRSLKGVTDVGVLTSVNVGSDHRMLRCILRLNRIARPNDTDFPLRIKTY
ncbi:hypothetical protein ANCDUO_08265 [Ancylostoma duodenale]|uniref:Endonuclease/exonuclease/phosphatase domain-containing protein n=1 Tax=Ancylostoma duodenale TaxID=51022 RepID=A0A0C2GJT7_9BILA|nr:hypothetical protein ANCDUO_08265 [Ancylostoma duodenale]